MCYFKNLNGDTNFKIIFRARGILPRIRCVEFPTREPIYYDVINWRKRILKRNVDMTVRGKSAGDSIQGKVNRDILFKVLLQKPTTKGRRELVHSTSSSFPSHISRKLLLEEHKLNIRLEKIEKERKLFLNRNSNEKHMLQLSMRTGKTSENRRGSGQCLVLNDNAKCHSSSSDHGNLKEGWLF